MMCVCIIDDVCVYDSARDDVYVTYVAYVIPDDRHASIIAREIMYV